MGKEMGFEVPTRQMQYDAADKETDQNTKELMVSTLQWVPFFKMLLKSNLYLGIRITEDLRWNTHVSNICTKANRTLCASAECPRRNSYPCHQDVKEAAYKGLVRPVLEYCSLCLDPQCVALQEELESVQKRTARFVRFVI